MGLALAASIERAHMGRIERGERIPNLVALIKLAGALDCTLAELTREFEVAFRAQRVVADRT